jgi:zinc protease
MQLTAPLLHAEAHPSSTPSSAEITALKRLDSLKVEPNQAAIKTPAVQEFRTQSGTRVLFVAAPELPIVDVRLVFDAGSARDSALKAQHYGTAAMTAALLDEGTSTQTTDQIAANFERLGVQYSASAYRDMFMVSLRSLSDHSVLDPAVEQLLSLLKDAQVPEASFQRVMQQTKIGLAQQKDSPGATTSIRFWQELYGTHPYAQPTSGLLTNIDQIKPADIRAFKDRFLVAHNLAIAIVGQMSLAEAQALSERITTSLPQGTAAPALPKPAATVARTVYVPFESSQSHVMIGTLGITRDNPDLPTLNLGNELFGGSDFSALLMKELREKRGLTYGAYSGFSPMHSNGPFIITYSTRADQTDTSIAVARQTLRNYIDHGVSDADFEEAKQGLLSGYPLSLASNANVVGLLGAMGFYNLPRSYLADYPLKLGTLTPTQVKETFGRYLNPDAMLTVVVGKTKPSDHPVDATPVVVAVAPAKP